MFNIVSKIFGTKNDRELKRYRKVVKEINALESKYEKYSDEELQDEFNQLKEEILNNNKSLDDVLVESFAITREASKRVLGLRHHDVQLIGGMVLHEGKIAEMKTGEGKTLVATLAVCLNAMLNKGIHVVTVNDYLAKRDALSLEPLYNFLGYSVGYIESGMDEMQRKEVYNYDITYGTNNEFGFDYLRDNMKYDKSEKVQRGHFFAIVDEVDSILIDEARTPLIISGPTNHQARDYLKANQVALKLEKGELIEPTKPDEEAKITKDFAVIEKDRIVLLSEEGIKKVEELFGVDNLYTLENAHLSNHIDLALRANYLFQKDVDYVVKDGQIVIVDEFTGRLSEGRRFSDGLHQALEAKEGVVIQEESQTLADVTFQNYFRMYEKLSGMTGTAQTEAAEFSEIYNLEVVSIPTNKPVKRIDKNDLIYKTEKEKFDAVIKKIKEYHKKGQPVLVGTASIEKSELLSELLKKAKIPHNVLNAKNHENEAKIIEKAGQVGAVTIATNMAGRGVDIKLPKEAIELGGLAIIGTERHESRRIDNQLRGRSGRQGDPGESQFYLSLEDNLLRIFGSDKIKNIMDRLGLEEGEHIDSKMVTRAVENAQKKVENLNFESRKYLLEYDDVANKQRKVIYAFRDDLLDKGFDISAKLQENFKEYISSLLQEASIIEGLPSEEYNLNHLKLKLKEELNLDIDIEDFKSLNPEEISQKLLDIFNEEYNKKWELADSEQRSEIERMIYLQILDNNWREHLRELDNLKDGARLQSYNNKDPLVEYKKSSYELFIELTEKIKKEVVQTLLKLQLSFEEPEYEEQVLKEMIKEMETEETFTNFEEKPIAKKIPRNDPCPCGSGKKYKHCCGKSGPKKGILAKK